MNGHTVTEQLAYKLWCYLRRFPPCPQEVGPHHYGDIAWRHFVDVTFLCEQCQELHQVPSSKRQSMGQWKQNCRSQTHKLNSVQLKSNLCIPDMPVPLRQVHRESKTKKLRQRYELTSKKRNNITCLSTPSADPLPTVNHSQTKNQFYTCIYTVSSLLPDVIVVHRWKFIQSCV